MTPIKPDDRLTETRLAKQKPLSAEDVVALMVDSSEDQRAITAHKVGLVYAHHPELSDKARKIGIEIFRIMVNDVAVKVRQELAETLKTSHDLPNDIALTLSKDVDSVSLPFIEFS
ncbi:MAG: Clp protease, partial [Alphaproteobacteria bacterium]|nr:Clp protease [Alphaproteobacteria bacterium]